MRVRRLAFWCLPPAAIVVLAVIASVILFEPSGIATVSWGTSTVPAGVPSSPSTPAAAPSPATADAETNSAAILGGVPGAGTQAQRAAALTAALSELAAKTPGAAFAIAVLDHKSGTSYTFGGGEAFETASVVKVDILAALLLQARDAGRDLSAEERSLAAAMITQSDNDAATALWWKIGDSAGLRGANAILGLTETVPGTDGWWGLTTTTVADQIRLLDAIADPSGPLGDDNQVILDLMGRVVPDQNWGVSAAATTGESTELKNGWMTRESQDGRWTVNSVGRVADADTDVTIAVMTRGHATLADGIAFVESVATMSRAELAW